MIHNVFYESEQQSLRFKVDLRWFNNKLCLLRLQPSKLSNIVLGISTNAQPNNTISSVSAVGLHSQN